MSEKKEKKLQNNNEKKSLKPVFILIIIAIFGSIIVNQLRYGNIYKIEDVKIGEILKKYEEKKYSDIYYDGGEIVATLSGVTEKTESGREKIVKDRAVVVKNQTFRNLGFEKNGPEEVLRYATTYDNLIKFGEIFLYFFLILIVGLLFLGRMNGMANNAMTFGKSRAKLYDPEKDKVLFKDVAGADEEKEELQEVVQFLKNPKKFKDLGAKIPKGVLLVGPPGTGKTMLARAVAGESGVPFLSISGSEFVEMFVGVGASRVRDLFGNAKKIAPAIIFIDEIDAIGKKRGPGTGGGHDEREQTLNQILTEMDGFDNDTNIIVMGATNRVDVLDKALLRPGRFDRKITVNLPNLSDREEILKIHASTRKVAENINFKDLASKTVGFSGADLGNLINESAIIAARYDEKEITTKRIDEAFERLVMGLRKKSQVMNDLERKITSYHEVGHAIVGKLLPNPDPVHKVSIVSRGGALGVTWFLPERDELLVSKAKYLDELAVLYGGRAAEEIFFGKENITTGASNDIERATAIARKMVTRYGMIPEIGAENFEGEIDRYSGDTKRPFVSDETIKRIDAKVKEILDNAYAVAIKIITENKDLHIKMAEDLLVKEEIDKDEFEAYFTEEKVS